MSQMSGKQPIISNEEGVWNDLAELILEAEIKDDIAASIQEHMAAEKARSEKAAKGPGVDVSGFFEFEREDSYMGALAIRVACSVEELKLLKGLISEEMWERKKLERLVRREQIRTRLNDYEELSYIAVRKLIQRVNDGHIKETPELIAVGQLGEKMIQMANSKTGSAVVNPQHQEGNVMPGGINIQINNTNAATPNGDLPGAGNLGFIEMNLHNRIVNQLSTTAPIDSHQEEGQGFLHRIEMLSAKEVPLIIEAVDGKKETEADSKTETESRPASPSAHPFSLPGQDSRNAPVFTPKGN